MVTAAEIRERGWAAAHEAAMRDAAIIPEGYELRTLVREVVAVWHDRHKAEVDAEIRAAFQAMHGAPPLLVEIVEEPCVDGRRVLTGPILVLVVARATRPAERWHPAPEPEPVVELTAPPPPSHPPPPSLPRPHPPHPSGDPGRSGPPNRIQRRTPAGPHLDTRHPRPQDPPAT